MRTVNGPSQNAREDRVGVIEIPMVWIEAMNRDTGETEGLGVWRGYDDERITVVDHFLGVSQERFFAGRGDLLGVGAIRYEAGFSFTFATISLSGISATVKQALRFYEPRGAQVQVWRRSYDLDTRRPLGVELWFPGYIDQIDFVRPEPGGNSTVEVQVVSTARMLTITSASKRSNEAQNARVPGDRFRRYKATTAQTVVPWGEKGERQDE